MSCEANYRKAAFFIAAALLIHAIAGWYVVVFRFQPARVAAAEVRR